ITLPDHILPRLPVKSAIRFKSVSKYWHSAISHPKFAESHVKNSYFRPQFLLFEDYDSTDKLHMYLLHYNEYKHKIRDLNSLPFVDDNEYPSVDLVGSCNCLLCLFLMELSGSFLVWNPAIRQHRYKPDPYSQELITGYGSAIDDYRVVASYSSVLDRETGCFFVYSAKEGVWKRICSLDGSSYAGELTRFRGMLIGDTLYWPIRHSKSKRIVGFNLVDETLNEVPGINWISEYDNVIIFGINGCLSLCCYKCDEVFDVWMFKQHGVAGSWEMLYSIDLKVVSILNFSKNGKVLDSRRDAFDKFPAGVDFHGKVMDTCDYVDTFTPPLGSRYYDGRGRRR
ncbi:hypothetical protein RND81_14G182100, partial [Saponaria officinalis]